MPAPTSGPNRIIVSALVHATENEDKVHTAICHLFPEQVCSALDFQRKNLRGHYHNPITHLEASIKQRPLIQQTLEFIGAQLTESDRKYLQDNLALHCDKKGQLFLRFDKQASYQGRFRLLERGDSVRIVIRFGRKNLDVESLRKRCQQYHLV